MKSFQFKKVVPYLVAIVIFAIIALWYVNPIFDGKQINQSDIMHYKGSSKEIADFRDKTGDEALWTNSMFGGMPAYQISVLHKTTIMPVFQKIITLGLPFPANIIFILFIGFFILLIVLKVDTWLSIIGSIAFAFSSYFIIFIAVGHNSQAFAIGIIPLVVAGIILVYQGKFLLGGALTALFMALEISVNHVQITYYMLFILGFIVLFELVDAIRLKKIKTFAIASIVVVFSGIISVLPSITNLWTSSEYVSETIRGKSELTHDKENRSGGLDKDYITQWSYGIGETFSLMIPDVKGGESQPLGKNKSALKNVDRQFRQSVEKESHYWGALPFTGGPVYAGAFIVFLFVLGLFLVKGKLKWALLSVTILAILLSWGHHFKLLTDFFIHYIPYYNKFRAVSYMLVIAEFAMPLLGVLAVKEIVENPKILKTKRIYFFVSLALTAGLTLLFIILPSLFFNFITPTESVRFAEYLKQGTSQADLNGYITGIETARISIFTASCWRSFAIIVIGALLLFGYTIMKKPNKYILYAALGILFLIDLVPINKRYLNEKNFITKKQVETPYQASAADQMILQDKDVSYRVLNLAIGNFMLDASTSYFHKSLGGYHAAKLRRYQDLVDHRILQEREKLIGTLNPETSDSARMATLYTLTTMNMLNTKYIIYNPQSGPLKNPAALGNAWFVNNIQWVNSADEEIKALDNFNPNATAIVDKKFEAIAKDFIGSKDSISTISLTDYKPNYLSYSVNNLASNQLVVFSEIYYDKGWRAFVDGVETPHFRANYVLRAMVIPAGCKKIEFRFEPTSYYTGEKIALAGSVILVLLVGAALFFEYKKRKKQYNQEKHNSK